MVEPFFWDCVDELAPFGSDEGSQAYYEWRRWRQLHPSGSLKECLTWILYGKIGDYTDALCADGRIEADLKSPDDAFLASHYDVFTLDTTIIATALGQLMDEGTIDISAKPYVMTAITRQLHLRICEDDARREILTATRKVVQAA